MTALDMAATALAFEREVLFIVLSDCFDSDDRLVEKLRSVKAMGMDTIYFLSAKKTYNMPQLPDIKFQQISADAFHSFCENHGSILNF